MKLKQNTIVLVGGARPNFIKLMPLIRQLEERGVKTVLVNAGQHFDAAMGRNFLREFGLRPDRTLSPSRTSQTEQFADMVSGLGKIYTAVKADLVLVVGDVNATLAGALAARLLGIPLGHVEAGLRSHNEAMPEERNRIMVDRISDYLFVTEESGMKNLEKEDIKGEVFFTGNIMIDAARIMLPEAPRRGGRFFFCTLHRAENVDEKKRLAGILDALEVIAKDAPVYLPLHPRTKARAETFGLMPRFKKILKILPPLSYAETLGYERDAALVLTDSGGIQEETTYLGTPCITLRDETERPVTVTHGTNSIGGTSKRTILAAYKKRRARKIRRKIPGWDGHAAGRIVCALEAV